MAPSTPPNLHGDTIGTGTIHLCRVSKEITRFLDVPSHRSISVSAAEGADCNTGPARAATGRGLYPLNPPIRASVLDPFVFT